MSKIAWVGVDLAKTTLVAAQRHKGQCVTKSFTLDAQGLAAFGAWLPRRRGWRVCVVFEPTGPYGRPLEAWLEQHSPQLCYALANPRRVRHFARAGSCASKTDVIDAQRLLEFAEALQPKAHAPLSPTSRKLRALSRHQQELRKLLDGVRDRRQKAQADPQMPAVLVRGLDQLADRLATELAKVHAEALAVVHEAQPLRHRFALLTSIPGVGPRTALALLAEYGDAIAQASARQLVRYAGLDPVLWQSGSSIRRPARISKQGGGRLRKALYMAALTGVRRNPTLRRFYERRVLSGLAKKPALIAAMRKLLHICYGVLNNDQPFRVLEATP